MSMTPLGAEKINKPRILYSMGKNVLRAIKEDQILEEHRGEVIFFFSLERYRKSSCIKRNLSWERKIKQR